MDRTSAASGRRVVEVGDWPFAIQARGGHGTPIVLLHGLLTDSRVWEPLAAELARDHRVVTVDAPGHGGSPARTTAYTLEDEADKLARLVELTLGGTPAIWVGHSMGGMKALRVALARPELVAALVLVSTQPYPEPVNSARHYEAMVETVKGYGMSADLAEVVARMNFHATYLDTPEARRWVEHFCTLTGEQIEQACYSVYRRGDISADLGAIRSPTLVVHGVDDVPIRLRVAREYVRLLPHGRLVELLGTGHTPPCERPAEVTRLVREFVESLEGVEDPVAARR